MKFENVFTVPAPVEQVWVTLLDLERVAPCMPGAEVLEQTGDNAYKVGIKVKVGPISMTYRGQVEITDRDDEAHRATMRVKAREARGQGTADATVRMSLDPFADGSQAKMETDLQLSGRAASMGRGVIGDVAEKLIETFAGNLADMLGRDGGATVESPAVREATAAAKAAATAGAAAAAEAAADASSAGAPPAGAAPAQAEPAGAPPAQAPPAETAVAAATAEAPPGSAAADGAGAAPSSPPPPPPPQPPKPSSDSLNAVDLAASVIAGRLKDPRTLMAAVAALGLFFYLIGYARGRRR